MSWSTEQAAAFAASTKLLGSTYVEEKAIAEIWRHKFQCGLPSDDFSEMSVYVREVAMPRVRQLRDIRKTEVKLQEQLLAELTGMLDPHATNNMADQLLAT